MASSYPTGLDSFATSRADSTPLLTTHALDHNNANDALNKIEAELGTNPSAGFADVGLRLDSLGVLGGLSWLDAATYGFTPNGNGTNVNAAWDSLISYLGGATPASRVVVFPPGDFVMTAAKSLPYAPGMRFIGSGGHRLQTSGNPERYFETTFRWEGAGSSTMLTYDGGASVVTGGPVFEHINFFNGTTGPDYTVNALKFDNVNDGKMVSCGFKFFGRNIHLEATGVPSGGDNAHWAFYDLFSYCSDYHIYGHSGYGMEAQGGEIIGDGGRTQYMYYMLDDYNEATIRGGKAVGCLGGVFYGEGGYYFLDGVRGEICGDATHPVVYMVRPGGAIGNSGAYNRIIGCTFNGGGTELPTRLGTDTYGCTVLGTVHDTMGAHPGLYNGQVRYDLLAGGGAWSSDHIVIDLHSIGLGSPAYTKLHFNGGTPAVRPTLADGSTLANVIDALQALGLVSP